MAYEVFDDVAFYFLLCSVLAIVLCGHLLWLAIPVVWRYVWGTSADSAEQAPEFAPADIPHDPDAVLCDCRDCDRARGSKPKSGLRRFLSVKNLLLVAGWITFMYLLVQLPHMDHGEMVRFDPFAVLELEENTSDLSQIKKAYRKASLKWHPDKNQGSVEAERMFMMITKAYNILTDPVAQENMERYGNPDGYQGVSRVTIGLPSFLTRKENEFPVLVLYFLLFLALPPIGLFIWWRKRKAAGPQKVSQESLMIFLGSPPSEDPAENARRWKGVTETMNVKTLVSVLACASEYRELIGRRSTPEKSAAYTDLYKMIRSNFGEQVEIDSGKKQVWAENRIRAWSLLQAHMLRVVVPEALLEDQKLVLEQAHKLCVALLDMTIFKAGKSRNTFFTAIMAVQTLQQNLTQALWIRNESWDQIPGFGPKEIRLCQRKFGSFALFRAATEEEITQVLGELYADRPEVWKAALAVIRLLPRVSLSSSWEVPSTGLFVNDAVLVNLTVKRLRFYASKLEREQARAPPQADPAAEQKVQEPAQVKTEAAEEEEKKKLDNADEDSESDSEDEKELLASMSPTQRRRYRERKVSQRLELMHQAYERRQEEQREREARTRQLLMQAQGDGAPRVRAPQLPFPKLEGWVLLLVRRERAGVEPRVLTRLPLTGFSAKAELPVRLPVGPIGCTYELILSNDSYLGCDVIHSFKLEARKPRPAPGTPEALALEREMAAAAGRPMAKVAAKPRPALEDELDSDSEDEDREEDEGELSGDEGSEDSDSDSEQEPGAQAKSLSGRAAKRSRRQRAPRPSPWYEHPVVDLAANGVVVFLVGFLGKTWLEGQGYDVGGWLQPAVDVIAPIWRNPVVEPILTPVGGALLAAWAWLGNALHREPPQARRPRRRGADVDEDED